MVIERGGENKVADKTRCKGGPGGIRVIGVWRGEENEWREGETRRGKIEAETRQRAGSTIE